MKTGGKVALIVGGVVVVGLLGLCVLSGVFLYRIGSRKTQTDAIVKVINNNSELVGAYRTRLASHGKSPTIHDITTELDALVQQIRAVDRSQCPVDFQGKYLRYCEAWEGMQYEIDRMPQTGGDMVAEALAKAILEKNAGLTRTEQTINKRLDALREAETQMDECAIGHGVSIRG